MKRLSGFRRMLGKLKRFDKPLEVFHVFLVLEILLFPHPIVAGLIWMAKMIDAHHKVALVALAVILVAYMTGEDRKPKGRKPSGRNKPSTPRDEQGRFAKAEKKAEK